MKRLLKWIWRDLVPGDEAAVRLLLKVALCYAAGAALMRSRTPAFIFGGLAAFFLVLGLLNLYSMDYQQRHGGDE